MADDVQTVLEIFDMNSIETKRSDESLITAIRANLCDFYRHLSRTLPEENLERERFTRWYSPLQHPWFNGVLSSNPPGRGDEAFIDETIEYFRSKNVGTFTWWMAPDLPTSAWEPVLMEHGFRLSDDTPGMAADLAALNESMPAVDGLDIHVVTDEDLLHTWTQVFTVGYGLPRDWESSIYEQWLRLGLGFPIQNYLGTLKGKPVATSCVFYGSGAAGIYSVSTLPKARGKGIGAAMTLEPLREARDMGYRIGVLQSSEMGYNVYKKLGFRHLCQIEYFYLAVP